MRAISLRFSSLYLAAFAALFFVTVALPAHAQPAAAGLDHVMSVQNAHTPDLMSRPAVLGTATGLGQGDALAVIVYVDQDSAAMAGTIRGLPEFLDDVRLVVRVTDEIVALKGPPGGGGGGGVSHRSLQTAPIELGTSGGWRYDLANGFCCGGTLGSLIQVGGVDGEKRILSNYHVFEADIVNGGNGIVATTGDFIIQPGLIDVSCTEGNAQNVATLVVTSSLPGSNVDASSANVISGMVDENGAILEVGTISSSTVAATLSQRVKKSGRTTGLTRSRVDGLNASVRVTYSNECAGGTAFTKTFTGQIILRNRGSKFIAGGDSGSLMVEDVDTDPGAVGLLYAGSSQIAVANPIDEVLGFFGASMVGN